VLIDRRTLLKVAGAGCVAGAAPLWAAQRQIRETADYTLRIASGLIELAPEHIVSTTLYNGQSPGPLLRLKEGKEVTVDIHNDTDSPELVHWHGLTVPSNVDGAAEEGSPFITPHRRRRFAFVAKPPGFRFYHTHVLPGGDLNRGTYSGLAGPLFIEPASDPGAYDREIFLVLKEFQRTREVTAATCASIEPRARRRTRAKKLDSGAEQRERRHGGVKQPCRLGPAQAAALVFLLQLPASATARLRR
jgi:hypothetical protein